jgi:predicted DNA-binding protein
MKRKVTLQLSEQIAERLESAAEQRGMSKAVIVESALERFLNADVETVDDATLLGRLNWMSRQLEQLERDFRIVNETVALHARYHLTITPPLPQAHQRAACALGQERFEVFAAQVGRRVHLGTPLMRETMDRLSATNPDLFARDIEEGAPLGASSLDSDRNASVSTAVNTEPELSAAAQEDGSNGGFPREDDIPALRSRHDTGASTPCPDPASANTAVGRTPDG